MEPSFATEAVGTLTKPTKVDREGGWVYGVRLVNLESLNNRVYPSQVLFRDLKQYDEVSVGVNAPHRDGVPVDTLPPESKFGRTKNPRPAADGSGGIDGDIRFNPKHPFAEQFCWACENDPAMYSLSQVALVKWSPNPDAKGRKVAETILKVARVDVVDRGGTTSTIFESANPAPETKPVTPEKTPPTVADVVATIPDPAALDKFLADLFAGLPSGTFTPDAKRAAVTKLLSSLGTPTPATEAAAVDWLKTLGQGGTWVAEKLGERLDRDAKADARAKALALCKDKGLVDALATDTFIETVAESLGNPTRAAALIEDRKLLTVPAPAPGAAPPRTTPTGGGTGVKKTPKQLAEELAAG